MLKEIGRRIRTLREHAEMTQSQLAGQLGINVSHLCNIEKGRRFPSHKLLVKLADLFGGYEAVLGNDPEAEKEVTDFISGYSPPRTKKPSLDLQAFCAEIFLECRPDEATAEFKKFLDQYGNEPPEWVSDFKAFFMDELDSFLEFVDSMISHRDERFLFFVLHWLNTRSSLAKCHNEIELLEKMEERIFSWHHEVFPTEEGDEWDFFKRYLSLLHNNIKVFLTYCRQVQMENFLTYLIQDPTSEEREVLEVQLEEEKASGEKEPSLQRIKGEMVSLTEGAGQ